MSGVCAWRRTWSVPLMAHRMQNRTRELEKPNMMLTAAVAIRPADSSKRGDVLAPSTPDRNFDAPADGPVVLVSVCTTRRRFQDAMC